MSRAFIVRLWMVLLLAVSIRIIGVGYGLPAIYHQDEPIYVNRAMAIGASGDLNPHFFTNGALPLYILFAWYGFLYAAGFIFRVFQNPDAFGSFFLTDPSIFYLSGRILLGVLAGTMTVWILARMVARRVSPEAGLAAGFFLAVNYLHATQSHYLYADAPLTLALTVLLALLADFVAEPTRRRIITAGVAMGAALACKLTAVYVSPAVLAAVMLAPVSASGRMAWYQKGRMIALFGLTTVGALFILSPFIFIDWGNFYRQIQVQRLTEGPLPWTFHLTHSILQGVGIPALILVFMGCVALGRKDRRLTLFLLTAAGSFYAGSGFMGMHFSRRMLPLMPLAALFAGCGWAWLSPRIHGRALRVCVFAAVALTTAAPAVYLDTLFLREDTRTQALRWFESNVPPGVVVAMDNRFFGPRLAQTRDLLEEKERILTADTGTPQTYMSNPATDRVRFKRIEVLKKIKESRPAYRTYALSVNPADKGLPLFMLPVVAPDAGALEAIGAEYLVFNSIDMQGDFYLLKNILASQLERVAVFSPYGGAGGELAESLDRWENTAAPHAWRELFRRHRLGPYLEIYRLLPLKEDQR